MFFDLGAVRIAFRTCFLMCVLNACYIDSCYIAFCTCFVKQVCKCLAWIVKKYKFLVFCHKKIACYGERFNTCFSVYFDDSNEFLITQPPRFCLDFDFNNFSVCFSLFWESFVGDTSRYWFQWLCKSMHFPKVFAPQIMFCRRFLVQNSFAGCWLAG